MPRRTRLTVVALDGFRLARRRGKLLASAGKVSAVVSGHYFIEAGKILGDDDAPVTLALYYLAPPRLKNTVLFLCSLLYY